MSAALLCWALVLGTRAAAPACADRHGGSLTALPPNETRPHFGVSFRDRIRRVLVEEVDKNGGSVVKELELPDYGDSGEFLEEATRRDLPERKRPRKPDAYGCDGGRESRRRKCLRRRKKLLRKRYRNWKEAIRRILKDLDGKIRTLDRGRERAKGGSRLVPGFSPGKATRGKE